jgi:hypothetical protein
MQLNENKDINLQKKAVTRRSGVYLTLETFSEFKAGNERAD